MPEIDMGEPRYMQPNEPIEVRSQPVHPLNDSHVAYAVDLLWRVMQHRLVANNERFPEQEQLRELWYAALEGTAIQAMDAPPTGVIAIEDAAVPEGADRAVLLRVEGNNGEAMLTSEILTGHHDPHALAERVRDVTRFAAIEDRRGVDDEPQPKETKQ